MTRNFLQTSTQADNELGNTDPLGAKIESLMAILLRMKECDAQDIDRARHAVEDGGPRLDQVLLQLGRVTERGLAEAYACLIGARLAGPDRYPGAPLFPERLSSNFLRNARAMPVAVNDNVITLVVVDALDDYVSRAVAFATGMTVSVEIAVPIELEAAFCRLYPAGDPAARDAGYDSEAIEEDAERLKDIASEAPVIRLVNHLISRAVETQASDIHIEPFEDQLRVRYRYDGVLHEAERQPPRLASAIISRIKIMAKLDIAERRLPQDGRIKLAVRGTDIDFRVSTTPTLCGEKVVLRVLDRSSVLLDYKKLGLDVNVVNAWARALERPNGIVLVTGPTGSGKTTTLYTGLTSIDGTKRNIVTVEDPIEYQLKGINQTQIKPQIGLTFAAMLRSILRQDPDVIMVGEIRDLETAQIAVQAALTGHLVLSTLHTNSAAATITRLRDLGLEGYLLTAVVRGILAQRLVRRLCDGCKREATVPGDLIIRLGLQERAKDGPVQWWHPVGCAQCRNTGYRGRQAIAEFLEMSPAIEQLVLAHADQNRIESTAVAHGMRTMFRAGLDAVLTGNTTLEEVQGAVSLQD